MTRCQLSGWGAMLLREEGDLTSHLGDAWHVSSGRYTASLAQKMQAIFPPWLNPLEVINETTLAIIQVCSSQAHFNDCHCRCGQHGHHPTLPGNDCVF